MIELAKKNKQENYRNSFNHWDEVASVRSKPLRILNGEEIEGRLFFTPELVPVANHPLVQERGKEIIEKILIFHLYAHLDFTENLEHEVVNKVAYQIGRGRLGFDLPAPMMEDAWKLYVDEAYHLMFSADLAKQVEQATRLERPPVVAPSFLKRLHVILDDVPAVKKRLIYLFFSIISETLITGTLSTVPKDQRVVKTICEVISDHAEDEKHHHAYFASLLSVIWGQLTLPLQRYIGALLPDLILGYLEPDYHVIQGWLQTLNFTPKEIERIREESYSQDQVLQNIRNASKITMNHLEKNGVLEEPSIAEVFMQKGLLIEKQ